MLRWFIAVNSWNTSASAKNNVFVLRHILKQQSSIRTSNNNRRAEDKPTGIRINTKGAQYPNEGNRSGVLITTSNKTYEHNHGASLMLSMKFSYYQRTNPTCCLEHIQHIIFQLLRSYTYTYPKLPTFTKVRGLIYNITNKYSCHSMCDKTLLWLLILVFW